MPVKAKSRIKKPVGYTPDGEPLFDYRQEIALILHILVEKLRFKKELNMDKSWEKIDVSTEDEKENLKDRGIWKD